jgi:DNA-binding transcriptional LysR family regulator
LQIWNVNWVRSCSSVQRAVKVTDKGQDFAVRAVRLLDDARELLRRSSAPIDPFSGVLRVGVCPAFLEFSMVNTIPRFHNRYPNMRFDTSGAGVGRTVQHLQNGGLDIVVGFEAALADRPDIQIERVGTLQVFPFVRRDHPLSKIRHITHADLAAYEWVLPTDALPFSDVLSKIYNASADEWRDHVHLIENCNVARQFIFSSDAIGIASALSVSVADFADDFCVLDSNELFGAQSICCAIRTRWDPSPVVRAFISTTRQAFFDVVPDREGQTVYQQESPLLVSAQ